MCKGGRWSRNLGVMYKGGRSLRNLADLQGRSVATELWCDVKERVQMDEVPAGFSCWYVSSFRVGREDHHFGSLRESTLRAGVRGGGILIVRRWGGSSLRVVGGRRHLKHEGPG